MSNYSYYLKRPFLCFKLVFYYVFGNIIGRIAYPSALFKSRHFSSIGSTRGIGWRWVTEAFFNQKVLGRNSHVPWPVANNVLVANPKDIIFHYDDLNNFMTGGNYFQALGATITIGKGTYIAPNVGLITANHNPENLNERVEGKPIVLGENCWVGMNAVVLPGIELGPHTIVGAGSVVTKSFSDGYCVIVGNPAKKIKDLSKE